MLITSANENTAQAEVIDDGSAQTIEAPYEVTGPEAPASRTDTTKYAGEFSSVEELEARYAELKAQLEQGIKPEGEPEEKPEGEAEEKPEEKDDLEEEAAEILKVAGLDVKPFSDEFARDGQLSEDSYRKLEEAGFPRSVVDQYIAGAKAHAVLDQQKESEIKGLVGGPDQYTEMVRWASKALTPDEIEAYDAIMHSGDEKAIRFAVMGLQARYAAAEVSEPSFVQGRATAAPKRGDVYRSAAEVTAAMRDPRYGKDPAYTRDVEQKLYRSDVF